ncbi:serine/threonine protein kinase [Abditibacterium utsteinense]|uniref:non-specific serine/threonine protein kinase n=1 Tax=Abditibacterium utsteinense TaxID=1960156 RepID=A0A2S8SX53_9BACT|nr:RIO1 family regulatory kinase/ATPase [Abditibacterium utsteinense]PQV65348.1 serine/threonine protein kinase [Abditibacterium utsteinense]
MKRKEFESQIVRPIHSGKGLQSSVYEIDWKGERAAVKDFSKLPPLFRLFIAPILVKREVKALRHLDGTPGIPRFFGQIDRLAFAIEFIEGRPISGIHKGEMPPEVFGRMARVVEAMHARGVAHGDLKRRSNLLLTPENEVFIIDFAAAIVAHGPISQKIMRAVAEVDDKSLPRLKKFVSPELLTEEDKWKLENPTKLEKWVKKLLGR